MEPRPPVTDQDLTPPGAPAPSRGVPIWVASALGSVAGLALIALLAVLVLGSSRSVGGRVGAAAGSAAGASSTPSYEAPAVGYLAPRFSLSDLGGTSRSLKDFRGHPVWINFWATWCPPCRAEMPEMQKIYDREKGNMTFLGVSMGPRDEPLGVAQFVQLGPYTWDFVHDPNGDVMQRYQVTGIPSSYFIDKSGVIRAIHVGGADAQIIEDNLKKATNSQ